MGSGPSKKSQGKLRLLPREPLQEKFHVPEEEEGYPAVRPPSTLKSDIYNPQGNRDIYLHALNMLQMISDQNRQCSEEEVSFEVFRGAQHGHHFGYENKAPRSIENSWEDLVGYLTSIYRTDMMKVRSLFSWLGTQSIENETFIGVTTPNDIASITPRGYKKVIKDREGSYATFFALLCRKAGLKCAIINGISKGNGYQVGDRRVSHLRDRWNAVYIDGWRIIHPLWAYKAIIGYKKGKWTLTDNKTDQNTQRLKEKKDAEILHDFNEYYFLVEPKELVTVCLPDKPKWQLCKPKMTLDKFLNLPYFQKRYHMEGFRYSTEFKSQLIPRNGICGLAIKAPTDTHTEYQLSYDFYFNHVLSKPRVDDIIYLKRYVMMSHDYREKRWSFEARMPVAGTYRITVYGGPSDRTILPWICDVGIYCDEPERNVIPYPDSPLIGFGPVSMTEKAGLTQPSHTNGALFVKPRQSFHITFHLNRTIEAKADLVGANVQEKQLNKWVTCTVNNPSTVHVLDVMVKLLEEGEYALKLFTRPKNSNAKWLNVCNYYLSTDPQRELGVTLADKSYKTAWELNARRALAEARQGRDLDELKAAVEEFEEQGLYETDGTYSKAARKLEYLELVRNLRDAINRRNLAALNKAIQDAEESIHVTKLQRLLAKAFEERDELLELNQYTHAILEMKQTTLSELVSYNKPLPVIHDVLVATLLLLGEDMDTLKTWEDVKACMRRSGKDNVIRRVLEFQIDDLTLDVVSYVDGIITMYDEDTVRTASAGAATFYCWTRSIVEEFSRNHLLDVEEMVPEVADESYV